MVFKMVALTDSGIINLIPYSPSVSATAMRKLALLSWTNEDILSSPSLPACWINAGPSIKLKNSIFAGISTDALCIIISSADVVSNPSDCNRFSNAILLVLNTFSAASTFLMPFVNLQIVI